MRYFSMFTGIGGFELGIQQAYELSNIQTKPYNSADSEGKSSQHFERPFCVGFSEIDKYASKLLSIKWPTVKNYGDATKIEEYKLPNFDLLVGGFPCQSFSIAGLRKGFSDTRGNLFFDIARVLLCKQPRLFLLENVKGLLSHDDGKTFKIIIKTLTELGYDVQWQVLNSKNFGVPQNRERVFIIGNLRGTPRPKVFPIRESEQEIDGKFERKTQNARTLKSGYGKGQGGDDYIGESPIVPTLRATDYKRSDNQTTVAENGMKIRRLTPLECERLQGFPDNWTKDFSDTQRYKMCGNAVTVNVVKFIISKLIVW